MPQDSKIIKEYVKNNYSEWDYIKEDFSYLESGGMYPYPLRMRKAGKKEKYSADRRLVVAYTASLFIFY